MNHKKIYLNSYNKPLNLSKKPFDLSLTKPLKKSGGRNNSGKITVRHKGGGHKRRYRQIDFDFTNASGKIVSIEYDPNRTAFIAGCVTERTGKNFYTLLPEGLDKNAKLSLKTDQDLILKTGHFASLRNFPLGSLLYSVEKTPGSGATYARAAGTYVKLIQKDLESKKAKVRLSSKKVISVPLDSLAFSGTVSNSFNNLKVLSKAGRNRWQGIRPTVRGVAMNPVDHPHGGGEGKTSGGRPSVTPWGRLTRGKPTGKPIKS